jgi:dihydrofolate reductase
VTGGLDAAMRQAREAAGDHDVCIAGGASTVQQALRSGMLDILHQHITPVTLGAGERLLADVGGLTLEPFDVVASPVVTHVSPRVLR